MTKVLDGKTLSATIRQQIREKLLLQPLSPHLVVLLTHPSLASSIYVRNKQTACKEIGIRSTIIEQPCTTTDEVLRLLDARRRLAQLGGGVVGGVVDLKSSM